MAKNLSIQLMVSLVTITIYFEHLIIERFFIFQNNIEMFQYKLMKKVIIIKKILIFLHHKQDVNLLHMMLMVIHQFLVGLIQEQVYHQLIIMIN